MIKQKKHNGPGKQVHPATATVYDYDHDYGYEIVLRCV